MIDFDQVRLVDVSRHYGRRRALWQVSLLARAGEIVVARATGLGPTRPGVNPGQPFPVDSQQQVNSPVEVLVAGRAAEVVNKLGWPGSVDTYRVDFRIPDGTPPGPVTIRLSAAWIAGPEVQITVQ